MLIEFVSEKVTKNTIKFAEILENDLAAPKIGTLYVQKAALREIGWQEGQKLAVEVKNV